MTLQDLGWWSWDNPCAEESTCPGIKPVESVCVGFSPQLPSWVAIARRGVLMKRP